MQEVKCPTSGRRFSWKAAMLPLFVGAVFLGAAATPLILRLMANRSASTDENITPDEDQIKTFEKTIIDGPTGYRFAHLTTVVLDGETGKITHMVTQMRLIPGPPVAQPKPTQKPEVNPNPKGGD